MSEEKEIFDKQFVYLEWNDILSGKRVFIGDTLGELRRKLYTGLFDYVEENKGDYPFTVSKDDINFAMCYYDPLYDVKLAWKNGKQIQYRYRGEDDDGWDDTNKPCWDNNTFEYRVKPASKMWTACIDDKGVISVMPASDWNKNKGRQLIEDTEEKCRDYANENYCYRCIHAVSICCCPKEGCQGFRELSAVKKRRWTNRELAQWVWQGNGQVKHRDGYYTLIACTAYDIRDDNKPCPDYLVIRGWDETEWHEPTVEE